MQPESNFFILHRKIKNKAFTVSK